MTALVAAADKNRQVLRTPGEHGSPFERTLAEANRRGREDSLLLLGALMPGFDLRAMTQRVDGGTLQVAPPSPAVAEWFDGADLLDRLVGRHDLGGLRMKLLKEGERVDTAGVLDRLRGDAQGATRAPAGRLGAMLDRGHTAVFDGIDLKDARLRRFAEHVERVFGCQININGYLSLRPHQSFGAHWDDHEVIIVQVLGHKRWEVHEPVGLSPHKDLYDPHTTGAEVWTSVIEPGTILHLPRGWGHNVIGVDELTFHLTVTIPRVSVLHLVDGSLGLLHRDERSYDLADGVLGSAAPSAADLRSMVAGTLSTGSRADILATRAANVASRPTQLLGALQAAVTSEAAPADLWVRAPHPGGVLLGDETDAGTHLVYGRRSALVAPEALEVLASALDGRARLATRLGLTQGRGLVAQVVREALLVGLLEVVEDPTLPGITRADET